MKESFKIIIAAHKEYPVPQDKIYLPVFVGAELKNPGDVPAGFTPDNSGENISALNPYYCELTALYWARNNLDCDYIGLAHYRRHFSLKKKRGIDFALTAEEISPFLGKAKIFTPKRRKYYIETLYSHYAHTFDGRHLDTAREIIAGRYPGFVSSFDRAVNKRSGYMFNMMIMRRDLLCEYCDWLFDILADLRKMTDESGMDAFQKRYPGRVSEILFNVWLDYAVSSGMISKDEIKEIPVISTEKVNWLKKGTAFLKAKFFGKKYEKSF